MRQVALFMLLVLMPFQANAIVNAEKLRFSGDAEGLSGAVDFSVKGSSGNSRVINAGTAVDLGYRRGSNVMIAAFSYHYGKSNGALNNNKWFSHLRYRRLLNATWAAEAFGQVQHDEFSLLSLRKLYGGGLRWTQARDRWTLAVGFGGFYEQEKLLPSANEPISRLWRGNSYIAVSVDLNDHVSFQDTCYYQPAMRSPADYRVYNNMQLKVNLTDTLAIKNAIELKRDSRPPRNVLGFDLTYTSALEYSF